MRKCRRQRSPFPKLDFEREEFLETAYFHAYFGTYILGIYRHIPRCIFPYEEDGCGAVGMRKGLVWWELGLGPVLDTRRVDGDRQSREKSGLGHWRESGWAGVERRRVRCLASGAALLSSSSITWFYWAGNGEMVVPSRLYIGLWSPEKFLTIQSVFKSRADIAGISEISHYFENEMDGFGDCISNERLSNPGEFQ